MIKLRKILLYDFLYYLIIIFCIILAIIRINTKTSYTIDVNQNHFYGRVSSFKVDGNHLSFVIDGKFKLKGNYYIKKIEEYKYLKESLRYGTHITVKGIISKPINNTIPNTFNYKKYLKYNNIYYIIDVEKITINHQNSNVLYKCKNYIYNRISTFKSKDFLYTFILGNKDNILQEEKNSFNVNGISHLFAISGMHILLFSTLLLFLLKKIGITENKRYILVIVTLFLYTFITSFSPSVLRSTLFFSLLKMNKIFYTNIKTINILIIVICILITINPFYIYDIGFLYSVFTSLGLILFSNHFNKSYIFNLFLVSLVAFIFSFPITVSNFFEINLLSLVNNLIFVPLVSFIIYPFSVITIFIKLFDPINEFLTSILTNLSLFISNYKIIVNIPKVSFFIFIVYYILIIYYKRISISILLIAIIVITSKSIYYFDNNSYIYNLDVNQGDSTLIIHNKNVIMIDTGGKLEYSIEDWKKKNNKYHISDNTITFLKSIGITKIDLLILTHGDEDHAKDANNIIDNVKVLNIMLNKGDFNELEKNINTSNTKIINNINNEFIKTIKLKDYNNENDNSIITYININDFKFLFMGDASKKVEYDLINKYNINKKIDVLHVGHHGSKTSTSENLLKNIKPNYAIISSGRNNKFNHPSKITTDLLEKHNIKTYNTQTSGTIIFKISKKDYTIFETIP